MSEISGKKQRLLIVDDSKVIRVTARKILQKYFETVEAIDGNNAWEILNNAEPFSLIVSDLTMPNLDGFGLLEKIRNSHLPHVNNIPVIIITGANDSEVTMQRATAAGATDFIGKPFDSVHLLARTQAHASTYVANKVLTEENISLEDRALVDSLSGLANDMAFMEQGFQQLAYAIRHNTRLAVACIEIDNFGDLVKQHDTAAGELIIKSVGSTLATNIRKEDMAARTGTARFALLLPGMDTAGISNLSNRITGDIGKQAVIIGGKGVRYTISIGIASPAIHPETSLDDLLTAAGDRLKQVLARGGNHVMLDEPDDGTAVPEVAAPMLELTLAPTEKADFSSTEQDDTLAEIECLQIETLEPHPGMFAEPAIDTIAADSAPEADFRESAAAAQFDIPETADEEIEESIVITSPYSLYDLEDLEITETAPETGKTTDTDTGIETQSPPPQTTTESEAYTQSDSATPDRTEDSVGTEGRSSLFMRILRVLFGTRK